MYITVLLYLLLSLGLCLLLLLILNVTSFSTSPSTAIKLSPFECGFEAYTRMRRPFSVRYFILIVLFLIFDVEAVLLFPCLAQVVSSGSLLMYVPMFLFVLLLTLGLLYEWKNGMLNWLNCYF